MAKKDIILGGVKYESIDKIIVKEDLTNNDVEFFDISQEENLVPENIKDGITLYGIQGSLQPAKEEETKTISNADFASGNIVVEPTTNKVMTKVTINKDTTNHIGENIKDGITLYGIQGSLQPAKTEQEKTVSNPNFSAGDVVVTPDANKVLSKATVKKDANLVAGNIKDGVTLFGVTGDYEGEGGGGLVPGQAISPFPVMFLNLNEIWTCQVYQADDIDGTNESLIYDVDEYTYSATIVIPLIVNKYYKVESFAEVSASSGKIIKYNTQPLSIQDWPTLPNYRGRLTRIKAEETTAMFAQCWDDD